MAKVDELVIELRAQTGQFESAMGKAGKTTRGFEAIAQRATVAAAAIGAALVATAKKAIDMASRMKDLSQETGVAASTFSALQAPLQQSGSSVEEFAGAIVRMNRGISDAASGNNESLTKTFNELGLSLDKLGKLTPEEKLNAVIQALARVKDQGDLTRLGVDIFGKSFSGLIPVIRETNGDLSAFAKAAQDAGNALTDEQIDRLDRYADSVDGLAVKFQNFTAKRFLDVIDTVRAALLVVAQLGIEVGRIVGLIDNDIASSAIDDAEARLKAINNRTEGGAGTKKESKTISASGSNPTKEATENAKKLRDELDKLQRETSRDVYTSGMSSLEQKLAAVKFDVTDLAARYKTKLTPEIQRQIETIQDNITMYDSLQKKQMDAEKLAQDLGGAFSTAFEEGVLGAKSFGDVLGSLGQQIEKVLFNQLVTSPLNKLIGGAAESSGGIGGIFSSLFGSIGGASSGGSIFDGLSSFLPSFAVGTNNVPKDMTANIHKGEMIVPAYDAAKMRNGGMGGGVNVTVVNNAGANVRTESSQNQSGGTDLKILIDEAVANNISQRGTKTSQALQALSQQTNVRR